MKTSTIIILVWLAGINLLAFGMMLADKRRAKTTKTRIPEKTLFVTAARREQRAIVAGDYGYTAEQAPLTGFPRHDKLLRPAAAVETERLAAVMPTWRTFLHCAHDSQTGPPPPNPAF